MKNKHSKSRINRRRLAAVCTVPAAALMLGVSQAATIGLHFQPDWTDNNSPGYTGFPVTATAFGIAPSSWQNLTPLPTGYNGANPGPFALEETIDTTTSGNGLNPLSAGSLKVEWSAVAGNTSGFAGNDPGYGGNHPHVGEQEVYYGFLRDDVFIYTHPVSTQGYKVKLTGLKSLFPASDYVIQLVAATDSGTGFTNAVVTAGPSTQDLTYTASRPDQSIIGGLSSVSTSLSTDVVSIAGAPALKLTDPVVSLASTIAGIIITDVPLIETQPSVKAATVSYGDAVALSVAAIGVGPLKYQWRLNGAPIAGATGPGYPIATLTPVNSGTYDVVVSNVYGSATSSGVQVTGGVLLTEHSGVVLDSKPSGTPYPGANHGSGWLASSTDANSVKRTGVGVFSASHPGYISVDGGTNLDSTTGTISFWVRSAGPVISETISTGNKGATILDRRGGSGLQLIQKDDGTLQVSPDGSGNGFTSSASVSDNAWHHVAITFDQSETGSAAIYIDGSVDTTNDNGAAWSWPVGQAAWIGLGHDGYWRPFDGQLDDYRVYNRVLTATEIASITSSDAVVDAAALKLRYNFDAAAGDGLALTWLNGTAQSADALTGPYTDVSVASPLLLTPSGTARFFRLKP